MEEGGNRHGHFFSNHRVWDEFGKKKSFQEKNKLPDSNMKAKEISAKEEVGGR